MVGEFFTIRMVHGHKRIVKKQMGQRRQRGYWTDVSNVEKELKEWMEEHDHEDTMPKHRELMETGATSLSSAIVRHGGLAKFAKCLGLDSHPRKSWGYWKDFENVVHEVEEWMQKYGTPGLMPTREELRNTGHGTLSNAVTAHGGIEAVAVRLQLVVRHQRHGYWAEEGRLSEELAPLLSKVGLGCHSVAILWVREVACISNYCCATGHWLLNAWLVHWNPVRGQSEVMDMSFSS